MFKHGLRCTFFVSTPSIDGVDTAITGIRYEGNTWLMGQMATHFIDFYYTWLCFCLSKIF